MVGVQDCGRVIDELTAESQVIGAMIQGISYALHEDKVFDHRTGRVVNPDFLHYKIAGPKDMPELEAHLVVVATGHTNTGAMGIGEPPAVAAPAAIANAVRNAIGVPVRSLPITPDKVLAALAKKAKGEDPRVGPDRFPDVPYPEPMFVLPPWEGGDGNATKAPRRDEPERVKEIAAS
jgi:xanthine dehydrogenase YagR molybdenum-binding subunit